MRKYAELKNPIANLRSRGYTYGEIRTALNLSIPKSTLSYICRDIPLPSTYQKKIEQLNTINAQKGRQIALVVNREKRQQYLDSLYNRTRKIFRRLNEATLKVALAMLYLGEGAKWRGHRGLMLGSSDPGIIRLYIRLLQKCYGVGRQQLRCRVQYRTDQDIKKLQRFWAKTTGIPSDHFYKTKPDPRTEGRPTKNKEYKGVCVVTGGSTEIQLELEIIAKLLLKYLGH